MNLTEIKNALTATLNSGATNQATTKRALSTGSDLASKAQNQTTQAITGQAEQSDVKLSASGQLKSALSDLNSASSALSEIKTTDSKAAIKEATKNFVNAFNNANKVTSIATQRNDQADASLAAGTQVAEQQARAAAVEINRALSNSNDATATKPSATTALQAIGITSNTNGSLVIDQAKFTQALQTEPQNVADTLANTGIDVTKATSRQLENNDKNSRSAINTPANQTQDTEAEQIAQQDQSRAETTRRVAQQTTDTLNNSTANSIAAYQKVFSL